MNKEELTLKVLMGWEASSLYSQVVPSLIRETILKWQEFRSLIELEVFKMVYWFVKKEEKIVIGLSASSSQLQSKNPKKIKSKPKRERETLKNISPLDGCLMIKLE